MRSEKNEILTFIQVLANHPGQVKVRRIEGTPVIFEIRACKEDLADLESKEQAIQVIVKSAGLKKERFVLKFIGDDFLM